MGTWVSFQIGDYDVMWSKNRTIDGIMAFFTEDHRAEVNDDSEDVIRYEMPVTDFIRRLEINSYTLENARVDYNKKNIDLIEFYSFDLETQEILSRISFDRFTEVLRVMYNYKIYSYSLHDVSLYDLKVPESYHEEIYFLISSYFDNDLYDFFNDQRHLIRIFCEFVKEDSKAIYDVSQLIDSGYYPREYMFATLARTSFRYEYIRHEKIIVLTEGKSDSKILNESMKILYPELIDYYSFLDFDSHNIGGGVSDLVHRVKSFAAAGIANRIVAIFDNDTAAHDTLRLLEKISIPDNIVVLTYPDLEIAKEYPTIGPSGNELMDINGMACSIELYLGKDILQNELGFIPIQWKGYISKLNRYQGEVLNKNELQKAFLSKIIEEDFDCKTFDLSGVKLILDAILEAFKTVS